MKIELRPGVLVELKRVVKSDGRYFYIQDLEERKPNGRPKQKWHPLTRVEQGPQALVDAHAELLGTAKADATAGNANAAIAAFKKVKLPELTHEVKKEYERMLDVITKAFTEFDVDEITPGDVLSFLNDNFSAHPTARRSYKARLSTFFSWCVLERLCATNPCREIKLKAPPRRKVRMTPAIYWAMHDALPPIGQCFLELCFLTTARPTEIRLLEESQIDAGVIHFLPSKTEDSSGATVDWPITPEIERVLKRARTLNKLKAGPGGNAPVIQDRTGSTYGRQGLFTMWKNARKAAGITAAVTTRDIRAFALTTAEKMGYALDDLRKAAAHTTTSTTEGYLDQYRQVVSPVRLAAPERPKT